MTKALTKPQEQENWNGYTIEELRYRRAYIGARCELEKEKLLSGISRFRGHAGQSTMRAVEKVGSAIPLFNYALLAFTVGSKVWRTGRRIFGRRKK